MKRLLIDANPIVPVYAANINSGIARTCIELIKALDKIKDSLPFEISLYTQNIKGINASVLNTGFKTHHCYLRNIPSHNNISRRLHLRELLSRYDLQHITHNYEIVRDPSKCIATVHDAFFMKFDNERFDYANMRKTHPDFIRKCRHIITCSEYSKRDIVNTIGGNPDKITVIPWGIDHDIFYVEDDRESLRENLKAKFGLTNPYFLSVSCDVGRKRTLELIKAYLKLENPKNDLVLVWRNPPENVIKLVDENPQIHFLSDLPNHTLRELYNCATASINPTSYEGFGLPILEAMACGCPIITCKNSSLPEVGGNIPFYLEEPVSESLPKFLSDFEVGLIDLSQRIKEGVSQSALFTWAQTAILTAQVYDTCLNISPR